nr:hypothetical protein [Tanacetum cinerariifolium]
MSSEITQSPGGSSNTSKGSENSVSFEDSGRSYEEYSEYGASSKEGGFENLQVRRSTREAKAPVRYSSSANYLLLTENDEPESYSEALSSKESVRSKKAIIEEMVSLEKNHTCSDMAKFNKPKWQSPLVFEMNDIYFEKQMLGYVLTVGVTTVEWEPRLQKNSWNEEPYNDVHQVGDELEVKVLRSFNWPPSELITEDGFLPRRGYSHINDVSSGYFVSKVSDPCVWIPCIESLLAPRLVGAACSVCSAVQKGRPGSSFRNAAITKPEKPKSRSKHLALTTPRIGLTSTTILVRTKRLPLVMNCALGLAAVKTWQQILKSEFGIKKPKEMLEEVQM